MGIYRPSVEIITPAIPERWDKLAECHRRVMRQTYLQDFGGTMLHTIVVDGPATLRISGRSPAQYHWLGSGPHHDHGSAAINYGVERAMCDLVMQLADDEWLEDMAIKRLVDAHLDSQCDFAIFHRKWDHGGLMTGDPPVATNLTTGLFRPALWKIAQADKGPSGVYTQPGADGMQAWDWLQRGATMAIVPEVLSYNLS